MNNTRNPIAEFFAELKRRRVLHIGGVYIAGAWLGAEILNFLFEQFHAPDWAYRLLAIVFVVGFPISMVLAWVIQVQEDGRWAIDPSRGEHRTLALAIVLGALITAGLSWLILPKAPVIPPLPNSLAVLPFTPSADTPNEQTAAETLYRSLMSGLERSPELTLIRLRPAERAENLQEFAESLSVEYLASGRISASSNGQTVEVQLLDVVPREVTWTQSYTWDSTTITETAAALTNGLLEAMGLPALSQDRFTGTDSREAWEAFMRGEQIAAEWTDEALERAAGEFQKAINADRGYTRAYVGLAQALYDRIELAGLSGAEKQKLEERAREAVNIAQKLDPQSPDALSLLGLSQTNSQIRIVAFERALQLDPDHYMSYYRYALQMKSDGKLEDAEQLMRRAIALRPMSPRFRKALAGILRQQGREEEAQAELDKAAAFQF